MFLTLAVTFKLITVHRRLRTRVLVVFMSHKKFCHGLHYIHHLLLNPKIFFYSFY